MFGLLWCWGLCWSHQIVQWFHHHSFLLWQEWSEVWGQDQLEDNNSFGEPTEANSDQGWVRKKHRYWHYFKSNYFKIDWKHLATMICLTYLSKISTYPSFYSFFISTLFVLIFWTKGFYMTIYTNFPEKRYNSYEILRETSREKYWRMLYLSATSSEICQMQGILS